MDRASAGMVAAPGPRRVLARVMTRLCVAADDPVWDVVRVSSLPRSQPRRFIAPARWRDGLLAGSGPLLYASTRGEARLRDPSGRLLLAGWRGRCPRPLLPDLRTAFPSTRPPGDLAEEVVGAWETATHRWLRRFAGLGLRAVARRPAALAATPTHVDIHFDLARADARIRRAGLDLDPGWIVWFGRVVAFHYDAGGAA